jgi:hypothetical protein
MNIQERLEIFHRRLEAAPPAASAEEAMNLVCRLIEQVEDEFCPVPRATPPPFFFTGRMYAPADDMIKPWSSGGLMASTRRHFIFCSRHGHIAIRHKLNRDVWFRKPGKKS